MLVDRELEIFKLIKELINTYEVYECKDKLIKNHSRVLEINNGWHWTNEFNLLNNVPMSLFVKLADLVYEEKGEIEMSKNKSTELEIVKIVYLLINDEETNYKTKEDVLVSLAKSIYNDGGKWCDYAEPLNNTSLAEFANILYSKYDDLLGEAIGELAEFELEKEYKKHLEFINSIENHIIVMHSEQRAKYNYSLGFVSAYEQLKNL